MHTEQLQLATTYPSILGGVLSELRNQSRMQQKDIATKVGVTQATWSRIESGQTNLTLENLRSVARALDTQPSRILAFAEKAEFEVLNRGVTVLEKKADLEIHPGLALIAGVTLGVIIAVAVTKTKVV